MQEPSAIMREYRAASFKRVLFCISAVLFSGLLMLGVNFAESAFAFKAVTTLFGEAFLGVEWQRMLAEIVLYLLLLLPPGLFLLIVFRKNPFSPFAGPLSAPPLPFLFVPMCIGALYALNFAVNLLLGGLFAPFDQPTDLSTIPMTLPGMLLYFLHLAILPALLEEWLFRGIMMGRLIPTIGKWPAVFLSAFVFGLMHLNPAQSIFAFGFGIFAGYAYLRTGSIWFAALIHMLNNAVSGCFTYWLDVFNVEWVQWIIGASLYLMMLFGIISLVFYLSRERKQTGFSRRTREERLLPDGGTVMRALFCSPMLYLLIGAYAFLLWLYYLI